MIWNLLFLFLIAALAVFFVWLAIRTWRSRNLFLKVGGGVLTSLLALVFLALTGIAVRGMYILYWPDPAPAIDVSIEYTPERIARGQHLAETLCTSCHSTTGDLPMTGGFNLADDIGMPLGDLYAPNITLAGNIADKSDAEIVAFFRYGKLPEGRTTIMPVRNMSNLSDEDLYSVVAFLRSQESVESDIPEIKYSQLLILMVGAEIFPTAFQPKTEAITAPPVGSTAEYGEYIISYQDCRDCHGVNLDGVLQGPFPPGPSLLAVKGWSTDQFITAMRTGITPSGHEMQLPMPWKQIGRSDDVELEAIYEYLKSLP